jgi:FlaA1/EpsC-like NDP-sugar epimerase
MNTQRLRILSLPGAMWHTWPLAKPLRKLIALAARWRKLDEVKIIADLILILVATSWTWMLTFGQVPHPVSPLPFIGLVVATRVIINYFLQVHRFSWLQVSRHEFVVLGLSAIFGSMAIGTLFLLLPEPFNLQGLTRPTLLLITEPALYLVLLCAARVTIRAANSGGRSRNARGESLKRALIVGAQAPGRALAFHVEESRSGIQVVGFVDEDPLLNGRLVRGIPVLGTPQDVPQLYQHFNIDEIIIAVSPLPAERLRELLRLLEPTKLPVRILPPVQEMLIGSDGQSNMIREVRMEDLLARPEVELDYGAVTGYLTGKTVLVTGGGGSIGSELCRQVLAAGAKQLLILGRGENSVFEITQELKEYESPAELVPIICNVRDRAALSEVFKRYQPQVVFHAAAHKHVPLMEQYPCEAVNNNVFGTLNVVELAVEHQVERFVMVSTDKAVDPANVMGATKRLGEMIVQAYASASGCNMVSVRFGNVLGSRGSVVPTMKRQIQKRRPVTITDPQMTRFFMTIPEASRLILQAGAVGGCGDVFILDMGQPVRILDLAHDLIRLSGLVPGKDVKINIVGCRPGEKIHEEILTSKEALEADKNGPFYQAAPRFVELHTMREQLNLLYTSAAEGDVDDTLAQLHVIVPEFRHVAAAASRRIQNPNRTHNLDSRSKVALH